MFECHNLGGGVGRTEYGTACHQYVGASLHKARTRFAIHAAVNFDESRRTCAVNQFAQAAGLFHGVLNEFLAAKTGRT